MFWDGRATGWILGDPLAEQAQEPFLNPLEQNNPNARMVIFKVSMSEYAGLFEEVWGPGSLDFIDDVEGTYENIARSISAYESSAEVNPFTSKYDYNLTGEVELTAEEARAHEP
jgi:cytochrome c peroxidase